MNRSASEQTKENLKFAMLKLYQKQPLSGISVRELCTTAGYNRSTFYLYYKDIYDLLRDIDNDLLGQFWENIVAWLNAPEDSLWGLKPEVKRYFQSRYMQFQVLLTSDQNFQIKFLATLRCHLQEYAHSPLEEYRNEYYLFAIFRLIVFWFERGCDIPFENILFLIREIDTSFLRNKNHFPPQGLEHNS